MIPVTGIITGAISAIQAGIPLAERIARLFKKKVKTDVTTLSLDQLQDKVKQLEYKDQETPLEWSIKTLVTLLTVYGVIWTAKHLDVTYDKIITLMGLISIK